MSESKHTPGPWTFAGSVKTVGEDASQLWCGQVIPSPWRGAICDIQSCDHIQGISREEAAANARLIAAAPDLLEALKAAKEFHDRDSGLNAFTADYECLRLQIDEAIAKAEGHS